MLPCNLAVRAVQNYCYHLNETILFFWLVFHSIFVLYYFRFIMYFYFFLQLLRKKRRINNNNRKNNNNNNYKSIFEFMYVQYTFIGFFLLFLSLSLSSSLILFVPVYISQWKNSSKLFLCIYFEFSYVCYIHFDAFGFGLYKRAFFV